MRNSLPPRRPDLPFTLFGLFAVAALLLVALLAELRVRQLTVLGDLRQLSTEAQHALERPSLLDVRHFARLTNIGERLAQIERSARIWPFDQLGHDRNAVHEAAQGLLMLGGQGKAFGELSLLLEKLRWEADLPASQRTPALQGLCGEDATIADMPRLRSVLGDKLERAPVDGAAGDKAARRGADQPMQRALALVDEFRGLRSQSLALLEEAASRPLHPLLMAGGPVLVGVAMLSLLAAALRWLQLALAVRRAARHALLPPSEADVAPVQLTPALADPAPAAAAVVAHQFIDSVSARAASSAHWLELRHSVRAATRLCAALDVRASGLVDPPGGSAMPADDDDLAELLQLATPLARAREATVNLALTLLSEDADPARVQALERLDQLLVAVLTRLRAHADGRGRDEVPHDPSSLVPRRELVALQSEIGHLGSQLEALGADIDSLGSRAEVESALA